MLVPGGIGAAPVTFLVEYESENSYRFVVFNTDPTGGLAYHPSSAAALGADTPSQETKEPSNAAKMDEMDGMGNQTPGAAAGEAGAAAGKGCCASPSKLRYQTALVVRDVRTEKMLDNAFWGMLFKLAAVPSKQNTPEKLYDLLLAFFGGQASGADRCGV